MIPSASRRGPRAGATQRPRARQPVASRRSRCFYLSDESYQLIIGLAQLVGGDQWSLSRTLDGLVLLGLAPDRDPATGAYDLAQARRRVLQLELEMGLERIEAQEGS